MDKDSIREFLEKREKELYRESPLPQINKNGVPSEPVFVEPKKEKNNWRKVIRVAFYFLIIVVTAFLSSKVYKNWLDINRQKTDNILAEVSRLTSVPDDEVPTIATVTNTESLRGQIFFKEALVGDKVLFYKEAKKAILYRPSVKKIIYIAPLN